MLQVFFATKPSSTNNPNFYCENKSWQTSVYLVNRKINLSHIKVESLYIFVYWKYSQILVWVNLKIYMFYINKMLPFSDQENQYFNTYILLRKKLLFYKLTFIEKNILHKVVIIMIWSCHAFYISMLYLHLFLVTDKYIACFQKSNFLTVYINRLTSLW